MTQRLLIYVLAGGVVMSAILVLPLLPGGAGNLVIADLFFIFATLMFAIRAISRPVFLGQPAKRISIFLAIFLIHAFISHINSQIALPPNPVAIIVPLNYIYGAVISFVILVTVQNDDDLLLLLKAWMLGGLIISVVSTLAILGMAPSWAYHSTRISSTMNSVNQVPSYVGPAMLVMVFLPYVQEGRFWKFFAFGSLPITMIAMIATGSRTPVIMIVVIFGLAVGRAILRFNSKPLMNSGVILFAGVMIFVLVDTLLAVLQNAAGFLPEGLTSPLRRMIRSFLNMMQHEDTIGALGPRGEQIAIVIDNWADRIFLGIGPGNFEHVTGNRNEVHNTYFGLLMEHGAFGLLLFLLFIAILIFQVLKFRGGAGQHRMIGNLVVFVLLIILLYSASSFGLRQRTFWIAIGLCLAHLKISMLVLKWSRLRQNNLVE
ncbi:O-antigen ligase family protein [Sulfitobacter sp. HGT1]|uniref:O-antigen ligase family protein n=1 Tax=Sulfitobacter sp. HGT1 TaxID=2735435 RepID=UPI0015943D3F|nr:O-antigen ligase family protein [Sulfitobacter sp. HGT1]